MELFEYWKEFPPAHEHLLIMSGYKPSSSPSRGDGKAVGSSDPEAMGPEDFLRFVQSTGGKKLSPNG